LVLEAKTAISYFKYNGTRLHETSSNKKQQTFKQEQYLQYEEQKP
jgi:hypothetical protein